MKKLLLLAVLLTAIAACDTQPVTIELYPPNDTVDTIPLYMKAKDAPQGRAQNVILHSIGE